MIKSRVYRRFKLAALRFRRIPDGLARLRLGCRQWRTGVDWHRAYRVVLSVVVIGSLLALLGFRDNFADRELAPLLAVVAAMGLAVMAGAHRPEGKPEGKLEVSTGSSRWRQSGPPGYPASSGLRVRIVGFGYSCSVAPGRHLPYLSMGQMSMMLLTPWNEKTAATTAVESVNTLLSPCGND